MDGPDHPIGIMSTMREKRPNDITRSYVQRSNSNKIEHCRVIEKISAALRGYAFDVDFAHYHCVCMRGELARDVGSAGLSALCIPETVRGFGSIVAVRAEVRGVCDRSAKK